jgi:hypothetical protein
VGAGECAAGPAWFSGELGAADDRRGVHDQGSVFNDSPYRVTDVRLAVEGFDANQRFVGRVLTWAFGDIAPGGETGFATEPLPGAVDYRIRRRLLRSGGLIRSSWGPTKCQTPIVPRAPR